MEITDYSYVVTEVEGVNGADNKGGKHALVCGRDRPSMVVDTGQDALIVAAMQASVVLLLSAVWTV